MERATPAVRVINVAAMLMAAFTAPIFALQRAAAEARLLQGYSGGGRSGTPKSTGGAFGGYAQQYASSGVRDSGTPQARNRRRNERQRVAAQYRRQCQLETQKAQEHARLLSHYNGPKLRKLKHGSRSRWAMAK